MSLFHVKSSNSYTLYSEGVIAAVASLTVNKTPVVQVALVGAFHAVPRRPREFPDGSESEKENGAPRHRSQGRLLCHERLPSSEHARDGPPRRQPQPPGHAGLWEGRWSRLALRAHRRVANTVCIALTVTSARRPQVEISENHVCYFVLTNMARFSLEVSLEATGPCELLQYLEATPKRAATDVGTQLQLSLSFCPKRVCNLQNIVLSIKVT